MAKVRSQYTCATCRYLSPKWLGHCPGCKEWNTFEEVTQQELGFSKKTGWVSLSSVERKSLPRRFCTGIKELDRVLGGGIVPDGFTLLGGDPGIGKSTLLLQVLGGFIQQQRDLAVLYVSGEESIDQIRNRAHRIGIVNQQNIFLASETRLEKVFDWVEEIKPKVLAIDSLQTFSTDTVQATPGSVSQVREITSRLMSLAKSSGIAIWLIGHVTKEGSIAGPKTVEHMVDTVLYFEGEEGQTYRLLRTVKNRFGNTREMGVFEMREEGLCEIANPSSLFLGERVEPLAGVAVTSFLEGSRPILVELQALVCPSGLALPRRTSVGLDNARISLIAAILEKHLKISLSQFDLFFNVVGGIRLTEPASDLATAAALWSSWADYPLPHSCIFIGELGLTGEVRRVNQIELRIEEAIRLGFQLVVLPEKVVEVVGKKFDPARLKIIPLSKIAQLPEIFLVKNPNT